MTQVAPGWYPDPGGQPVLRYWDGGVWTAATSPLPSTAAPAEPRPATPAAEPTPRVSPLLRVLQVAGVALLVLVPLAAGGAFDRSSWLRQQLAGATGGGSVDDRATSACRSVFRAYEAVSTRDVERHFADAQADAAAGQEQALEEALQAVRRGKADEADEPDEDVQEIFLQVQALAAVGPALVTLSEPPEELVSACDGLGVEP